MIVAINFADVVGPGVVAAIVALAAASILSGVLNNPQTAAEQKIVIGACDEWAIAHRCHSEAMFSALMVAAPLLRDHVVLMNKTTADLVSAIDIARPLFEFSTKDDSWIMIRSLDADAYKEALRLEGLLPGLRDEFVKKARQEIGANQVGSPTVGLIAKIGRRSGRSTSESDSDA